MSPSTDVRIVEDGRSDYRIVVAEPEDSAVSYAARELQRFLLEMTGVSLPIATESEAGPGPAFRLGRGLHAERYAGDPSFAALGEEGVYIVVDAQGDVVLLGQSRRAQIYAVYELLERFLGVRFLAWDCTVVPLRTSLTLPRTRHAYTPPFMYREILYFHAMKKDMALRHRLNGPFCQLDDEVGGKWFIEPYVHSFASLVPPGEFFAEHPEYFSLQGGRRVGNAYDAQLCLTNPEVLRIATERVLRRIEARPEVPVFDVSQNDGGGPCECDACMAIVNEEGSQHGPILRFVNAVADEVATRHPDKWIETLAYHYSTKPPAITRPRPNVIVRLCHVGNYFKGFEADDRSSGYSESAAGFAEHLKAWTSLTPNVFIWHYATNFGHYLAPNQNLNGLVKDMKVYAARGVKGLMVQANYESPGGELAELRQYLAAQLLWEPSRNPAVLREEFCRGYYGDAADDVLAFLALMDAQAEQDEGNPVLIGYANWDPAQTVSPGFVEEGLVILERAERNAATPETQGRIARLRLPLRYMQLRYPARHGVTRDEAHRLLREVRAIVEANGITGVREVILYRDPLREETEAEAARRNARQFGSMRQWLEQMEAKFSDPEPPVVFDLYAHMDEARLKDCLVWRADRIERDGEDTLSMFHHPPEHGFATAEYDIELPEGALALEFGTGFTAPTADGVRFAVLVNGEEIWGEEQRTLPVIDRTLDLGPWSGSRVSLTLKVDGLTNMSFDWAHWVHPRVVRA